MTIIDCRPFLAVAVSMLAALLIAFTGEKHRNVREAWGALAAVTKFGIICSMLPAVLAGDAYEYTLCQITNPAYRPGWHDFCPAGIHAVDSCTLLLHRLYAL